MNRDGAWPAGTHGDTWWYDTRYGCRCPTAVAAAKTLWREASAARRGRAAAPHPQAMSKRRLSDVDPVSVERACAGQPHQLTVAERHQAVALLTRLGLSVRLIATRLGVAERTVIRHRKANTEMKQLIDDYLGKARQLVHTHVTKRLETTDKHVTFTPDDVYVVWFCKTLQNWKALISTTLTDGMYYEVTHNGDQHETYIDAYKKFDNVRVVD